MKAFATLSISSKSSVHCLTIEIASVNEIQYDTFESTHTKKSTKGCLVVEPRGVSGPRDWGLGLLRLFEIGRAPT